MSSKYLVHGFRKQGILVKSSQINDYPERNVKAQSNLDAKFEFWISLSFGNIRKVLDTNLEQLVAI